MITAKKYHDTTQGAVRFCVNRFQQIAHSFSFFLSPKAKTEEDEVEDDLEYLRRWANEPS